jgi:hypothetical protein
MWRAINSDVTRNRDVEAAIVSQGRVDVSTRQGPVMLVQEEYMRLAIFGKASQLNIIPGEVALLETFIITCWWHASCLSFQTHIMTEQALTISDYKSNVFAFS